MALRRSGQVVELSVNDTGVGIKKEDIGRIFAPFQRIANRLKPRAWAWAWRSPSKSPPCIAAASGSVPNSAKGAVSISISP